MNLADFFTEYGILILALVFFFILGFKYLQYWNQVRKAMLDAGTEWPLHSQKELNETTRKNLSKGYAIMFANMSQAMQMTFSMRTDNPEILKPLQGMRRVLLAFILVPILFTVVLIVILAFLAV